MTLDEIALKRAMKAVKRAHDKSNSFDHGGLASWEVLNLLREALTDEFIGKQRKALEASR
jgi:hypothetical protein